jgi:hypothetical protein
VSELFPDDKTQHLESLRYGAFTMVAPYWAAKSPVESAGLHIGEVTNTTGASFTAMVGWQIAGQPANDLHRRRKNHMQVSVRWDFSWGKFPKKRDSRHNDSS